MKVFIVDDEEDICKRLKRELKREGCEAEYTTSPVDVLTRLRDAKTGGEPYDALLLDLRMPKIGGLELLKEIRKAGLDLDVIIITGYGDEDMAIEAVRLGAVDYLPKPISLDQLHTALFRVRQKKIREAREVLRHTILVVDDEKNLCDRVKRELEKEGYQAAVAYAGKEGLDYFKNNRVDLVIADIRMPGMSGLEMLDQCARITDNFVSIIITGHGDHETAIEALRLGVFNYLKKPVPLEELVVSVEKGIELLLLRRGLSARQRELEIETAIKEQYAKNLEKIVEERTGKIEKLSHALASLSEMVIITDLDHKIIYANAAIEKILGYTPREVIGHEAGEFFEGIPGNPPNLAQRAKQEAIDGIWKREIFNRRKDGSIISVLLSLNLLKDKKGDSIGCVGVAMDITERKQTEEELKKHREHLEEMVEKRTADMRKTVDLMAGREVRMMELKKAIRLLRAQIEEMGMVPVADDPLLGEGDR